MSMPVIFLKPEQPALAEAAHAIASRWNIPLWDNTVDSEYLLVLTEQRLELRQTGDLAPGAIYVDFVGGPVGHRRRYGGGRGQPIAKAVGLTGGKSPSIIDATAGLGRDAFVLASLGSPVTLIERSPVIAALLEDGISRAELDKEVSGIVARMKMVYADAEAYLSRLDDESRPDVIYLDPMYPPRKKSAQVKKEMRMLQAIVGDEGSGAELLSTALETARERVVVKRPGYAEWLGGREPTMAFTSKKHRFDVYVIKALKCE